MFSIIVAVLFAIKKKLSLCWIEKATFFCTCQRFEPTPCFNQLYEFALDLNITSRIQCSVARENLINLRWRHKRCFKALVNDSKAARSEQQSLVSYSNEDDVVNLATPQCRLWPIGNLILISGDRKFVPLHFLAVSCNPSPLFVNFHRKIRRSLCSKEKPDGNITD